VNKDIFGEVKGNSIVTPSGEFPFSAPPCKTERKIQNNMALVVFGTAGQAGLANGGRGMYDSSLAK